MVGGGTDNGGLGWEGELGGGVGGDFLCQDSKAVRFCVECLTEAT